MRKQESGRAMLQTLGEGHGGDKSHLGARIHGPDLELGEAYRAPSFNIY